MVKCFFLLIQFLVVEDYELPKSKSHILIVPLTLECVEFYLDSSFFSILIVSLMMLCNLR